MSYKIYDFLLDQKEELAMLEKKLKECKSEERIAEIKRQQCYLFNQGLCALRRYDREVPGCVREYFLGSAEKPSVEKISEELQKIIVNYPQINRKIAYVTVAVIFTFLFLIAIFS